jgi:hypothetical protein
VEYQLPGNGSGPFCVYQQPDFAHLNDKEGDATGAGNACFNVNAEIGKGITKPHRGVLTLGTEARADARFDFGKLSRQYLAVRGGHVGVTHRMACCRALTGGEK